MPIATINPTTNETTKTFDPHDAREIERRVALASETFDKWRRVPIEKRAELMRSAADVLETDVERFARLMTIEMGKPIQSARAEAKKCALVCRYYADHAAEFLANGVVATRATKSWIAYQPIGAVLAVMPWNFPFWQVFRFAAPGLMAGNVGLLKHASNVPQCALAIEEVFTRAGFPGGAFQTLLIGAKEVDGLVRDERVAAVTLTGSEPAGASVASTAGKVIKKAVLELGGSDPFIVMPSADLDQAVPTAVQARMINNGQSCIAAKRFILHEAIAEEFERRYVEAVKALKVGDPMLDETEIGPLATPQILDELDAQVRTSIEAGAKALTGGKRIDGPGNFYEPTVLSEIPDGSPARCDELFGPVASLFRISNIDEAIALANETPFGLGASAWTRDEREQKRFVDDLEAGQVFLNAMVASTPELPFGGVKRSGFGRELGEHGIYEFVNIKTVWVA